MALRLIGLTFGMLLFAGALPTHADAAHYALALDIFKELIEINTTESVGNVTAASEAMAKRLRDAGYAAADVRVLGSDERKKNLVVRLRGTGRHQPVLLIGHLDVVEAPREDWSSDPFKLIEKDGFFYGRGTLDMKSSDAVMVATFIRLREEGFRPNRDIILALTADEEDGNANGVEWLLNNHRELVDADFVLNLDNSCVISENGKPKFFELDATEKVYADYLLVATNPGGHSSLPVAENVIYELADGLARLARFEFPFELNIVTRSYYERMATIETGQRSSDMLAILESPPVPAALERLSSEPFDHATMRTTCVATRLDAGHANNALPQRAQATVNCRILPGHSPEEVRQTLIEVMANPRIAVRFIDPGGQTLDTAPDRRGFLPTSLHAEMLRPLETLVAEMWSGIQVVPTMSVGASDSAHTNRAGLASYVVSGIKIDRDDDRSHGRDERIAVDSFYRSFEFFYRYIKAVTSN